MLKVFETADGPVTLAELAARTGLYKSTILRLIASFEDFGHIRRLPDGTYALGPAVFRLGARYRRQFRLDDLVDATLQHLVDNGTESASFHIPDGEHRLCIARVDSSHPTLDRVSVGDLRPMTLGAAGKVISAHLSPDDPALAQVRAEGIALSFGELDPSCAAIATPVFGGGGRLLGAISLSGASDRFTPEAIARMRALLLDAARDLSELAVADEVARPRGEFRVIAVR